MRRIMAVLAAAAIGVLGAGSAQAHDFHRHPHPQLCNILFNCPTYPEFSYHHNSGHDFGHGHSTGRRQH